ncbi:uncharacterized protein PFL1_06276 [Pseudozyma flocculosa PF-1]|nr:uncharacterized protein PFL1_06276 [Pseudozyma flocculosa PF-1]EPQ26068.1 hypothetical protein PFL1_06276 [Pseudozyma flocculosa PF-1]
MRNLQANVDLTDASPVDFPRGALSRLQWVDTDFHGYEEWHESVLQPMHFLRRIRFGAPKLVRGDNHGHGSFDLLNDTTTQVVTVDRFARQAFGDTGRAIIRRMAATALPDHRFLSSTYMVHCSSSRHVARSLKARMRLYSVALPNLQLYEIHLTDASSKNGGRTYPRTFWRRVREKILDITYPIHFAIAVYHVRGEELADCPNWDVGDYRERASDISDDGQEDEGGEEGDGRGRRPRRNEHDYEDTPPASPASAPPALSNYVPTRSGEGLDARATKRSRRSLAASSSASASASASAAPSSSSSSSAAPQQHWEPPMILPPFSREWQPITLEGGLKSLPFLPPKEPHPYTLFVDQARSASVPAVQGPSRIRTYERGTVEWLRLVARNLEHGRQDLRL